MIRVARLAASLATALLTSTTAAQSHDGGTARGRTSQVLFIGNSLTYVNDLPGTVVALALSVGDTINVRVVALPNLALIDHVNGASTALSVISGGRWDYVVLQQGPSSLPVNRDTLVLATRQFDSYIKSSGAMSAQLMTWPSSDRPQDFPPVLESSRSAARAVGGVVFAAGQAWISALAVNTSLPLYGDDRYHPAPLGTYLAALVVYEGVTGHDARLLPARAIVAGRALAADTSTVRMLQRVAHETIVKYRTP